MIDVNSVKYFCKIRSQTCFVDGLYDQQLAWTKKNSQRVFHYRTIFPQSQTVIVTKVLKIEHDISSL
jgi:hypothetical protein